MKRLVYGVSVALVCACVIAVMYANPLCAIYDWGNGEWWILGCYLQ